MPETATLKIVSRIRDTSMGRGIGTCVSSRVDAITVMESVGLVPGRATCGLPVLVLTSRPRAHAQVSQAMGVMMCVTRAAAA